MAKPNATCAGRIAAMAETIASYNIKGRVFCERAGIAHSTWCRWKKAEGDSPRATTLDRAEAALGAMVKAVKAGRP